MKRRDFLKLAGGVVAGAVLSQPALRFLETLSQGGGERVLAGPESWVVSSCQQCTGGCGIRVRKIAGWPVRIEGNPLHPINRGGLCPKGLGGLQVLYDPDRIVGPLQRKGKRGEGQWQRISWEEALSQVASKLQALREQNKPHTLLVIGGQYRGLMSGLLQQFVQAFGSPNYVSTASGCEGTPLIHYLMQGVREQMVYDLENTNYFLSFGCSFLEAWWSPVRQLYAYGHMRQGRPVRGKIVQVDPRLSVTAIKANEWIPIRPGTDAALALGIAHVLIKEGLYNQEFVEEHTFGFEDWTDERGEKHQGFKNLVLQEYSPGTVSRITGVPVETIIRLGREFGETSPAVAAGERGSTLYSNGVYTRMAIHALNALVGSIDVPGGVLVPREVPLTPFPPVKLDAVARKGLNMPRLDEAGTTRFPLATSVIQALPENIQQGKPYKPEVALLYYANPCFSRVQPDLFRQALDQIPFIVSFSPFLDETTMFADLVLPDHTYLERWQDDPVSPSLGYPVFGLRQPVIEPLYDTRHTGDVILELARRLGGTVAKSLPWKDFQEVLRFGVEGIYKAQRGYIAGNPSEEFWYRLFEKGGIWAPSYRSFEEFWEQLQEKGGWWDPVYQYRDWNRVFRTPSGRFEFYSRTLAQELDRLAQQKAESGQVSLEEARDQLLASWKITTRGDLVFLPHYEPPRFIGEEKEYPLHLVTYKPMAQAGSRSANQPYLQDILGPHLYTRWDSWIELNPETARELGIEDGEEVWMESPLGKIRVRAHLYPGAMPGVVNMPYGLGHTAYGRWAKGRGANPNKILGKEYCAIGGLPAFFSTRVKLSKA
ncbi:MAG: hypothetical protein D6736_09965 [Nitrospinota bacterium]|nr:MAG: hypothetical protein D6736_09965 [Nitrospinota bacterium]